MSRGSNINLVPVLFYQPRLPLCQMELFFQNIPPIPGSMHTKPKVTETKPVSFSTSELIRNKKDSNVNVDKTNTSNLSTSELIRNQKKENITVDEQGKCYLCNSTDSTDDQCELDEFEYPSLFFNKCERCNRLTCIQCSRVHVNIKASSLGRTTKSHKGNYGKCYYGCGCKDKRYTLLCKECCELQKQV